MTLDPSAVTEALDRLEDDLSLQRALQGGDTPAFDQFLDDLTRTAAAARSWVEGEEVEWCTGHSAVAWNAGSPYCVVVGLDGGDPGHCRIVSARVCIEGEEGT